VVYSEEAEGIKGILAEGDVRSELCEAYQMIFDKMSSWEDNCRPRIILDDEIRAIPEDEHNVWKEYARHGTGCGYRLVLEDVRIHQIQAIRRKGYRCAGGLD
jgi:hypothetical protein